MYYIYDTEMFLSTNILTAIELQHSGKICFLSLPILSQRIEICKI